MSKENKGAILNTSHCILVRACVQRPPLYWLCYCKHWDHGDWGQIDCKHHTTLPIPLTFTLSTSYIYNYLVLFCPCPKVVSLCPLFIAEATLNVSPDEYLIRVCCHVPRVLHSTSHITSLLNMSPLLETWQYLFRTWIHLDIWNIYCTILRDNLDL